MTSFPFGFYSSNPNRNDAAMNTAAKNLAASNGIPFLSLYEYYGPWASAFGARQFDGVVHPNAALYSEIAGLMKSAVDSMVAAQNKVKKFLRCVNLPKSLISIYVVI